MINKKEFLQTFLVAALYTAFFFLFQFFGHRAGYFSAVPDWSTLKMFDAHWYDNVAQNGYQNYPTGNNTAFFILFPLVWKLSGLGAFGISLLNGLFFSLGFAFLSQSLRSSFSEKMLWLTVPAILFMYIPYTEALFFLLVSLAFFGIVHNVRWLIALSLFTLSFLRPTVIFMTPAALAMELMCNSKKDYARVLGNFVLYYLIPGVLGLGIFIWYQYSVTGVWFIYFYQQSEYWGHKYALPMLPFHTLDGPRTLWINALAMFIAFISFILGWVLLVRWLVKKVVIQDKLLVLSIVYISSSLLYGIFFNPTWRDNLTIVSAQYRYIMACPFFFVILHHFGQKQYTFWHFIAIILLANGAWMAFGAYHHIQELIFFNFNTLLIVLYMLHSRKLTWATLLLAGINFFLQATIMQQALNNLYPE